MSGSLPFRPHEDSDQDAREDGENDDDDDVDETVRSEVTVMLRT